MQHGFWRQNRSERHPGLGFPSLSPNTQTSKASEMAAGGREKTAPAPQLQYHPDYYATWVLDPDGHDVEVVNKTG